MITAVQITLTIDIGEECRRPHEQEVLRDLSIDKGPVQIEFLRKTCASAAEVLRVMMDDRRPRNGLYGTMNWPQPGDQTVGYGNPSGHGEHHQNCRCANPSATHGVVGGHGLIGAGRPRQKLGAGAESLARMRPHKPVTRKEAARAVRAVQKDERDQRAANRKTARAQAAIKGWETRKQNERWAGAGRGRAPSKRKRAK